MSGRGAPEDRVLCRECWDSGRKSVVTVMGRTSTCMPSSEFYDEEGRRHLHDRNLHSTGYACSNGHQWMARIHSHCWCGYPVPDGSVLMEKPVPTA